MRQQTFGRKATLDQAGRCPGDAFLAGPAGVLRPHGDDDPKLGGNDVKPLGAVLADAHHLAAAARAVSALGLDHLLNPWQVGRKMAEVALGARALRTRRPRGARRDLFFDLGKRAFELLESEREWVGMELLGLPPVHCLPQLVQQMFETAVVLGERGDLGAQLLDNRSRGPRSSRRRLRALSAAFSARSVSSAACWPSNDARKGGASDPGSTMPMLVSMTEYYSEISVLVCDSPRLGNSAVLGPCVGGCAVLA